MMKKLIYIIIGLILTACSDDIYTSSESSAEGHAMRFEVTVIEEPQTKGEVIDVNSNEVTRDFKKGDSFGLFIIDGSGAFVTQIDGKNAKNLKLTTPDGKAWNLESDIKEVVHKLGYKYVAYYPYSADFDNCASTDDIQNLLTAPADDQSTQAAIDWMYTDPTDPQTNAVTTLVFKHKYAKIDIYHSFTQDHTCNWASMYKFTKTVDNNKVEHYRYILNSPSLQTLSINGKYTIGDEYTGIKEYSYNCPDINVENGRHAIVYTYRMDERCAIDLGLPSGVKWSPINLGVESSNCMADTYMDASEIAAVINKLGKRLAWGELFEKDSYTLDSYIDGSWNFMPSDITETVYDAAKQLWGGHWSMPSAADINELIANTEEVSREVIHSDEIDRDINKITLRSKINGKEITFLTNGYMNGSNIVNHTFLYYMSANRTSAGYYTSLYSPTQTSNIYRPFGCCIRPVLKELYIYPYDNKKDIIVSHINDLAVDLGITKTVTENGEQVTYKLLWSPFNYGVESKVDLKTYNGAPIDEDNYISLCTKNLGMRLAWGDIKEPAYFKKSEYNTSAIGNKYPWVIANNDTDARNLNKEDDIVQLNWPSGWYIPTAKDFYELIDNTTITKETIDGHTWFRLTGKNGNSILIPATNYIDNADNTEKWGSDTYLQSCTIGPSGSEPKQYALNINSDGKASLASGAGRATGLMIRPVKYVRVQ
ncbi:MAG: fimbrillin family protein [Bacteroidales bacterium]|nr:fimbrillin family protein [Bacteroidales bacterium]